MLDGDRWEHGSDFHWPQQPAERDGLGPDYPWRDRPAVLCSSGRDALHALINHGRTHRGWRRLWVPAYFCQPVVEFIVNTGIDTAYYYDSPLDDGPDLSGVEPSTGDAVLIMNYFGLRREVDYLDLDRDRIDIVENHTHDPLSLWAIQSDADWCFASLRKTLPVPDGGVFWSPKGHELPPAPDLNPPAESAAANKLAGMVLKELYLRGGNVTKKAFRYLLLKGEDALATSSPSGMSPWSKALLDSFPAAIWRKKRIHNFSTFNGLNGLNIGVRILTPSSGCAPFAVMAVFDSAKLREKVRVGLIKKRIYPAVHWPMDRPVTPDLPPDLIELSKKIMTIHCDMRYDDEDMTRVKDELIKIFEAKQPSG